MSSEPIEIPTPDEDTPETPSPGGELHIGRVVVLTAIILTFAANTFLMPMAWPGAGDLGTVFFLGATLGMFIVQLDVVGLWTAMGPGRVIVRLPWGMLVVTATYVIHQLGVYQSSHFPTAESDRMLLLGTLVCGWLAITLCFAALGLVWRWRLLPEGAAADGASRFHLWHLIVGTALCGMALALLNWFGYPLASLADVNWIPLILLGAIAVVNLLMIVPALLVAYANSWAAIRLLLLGGYCLALSLAEFLVVVSILGYPPEPARFGAFLVVANLTQCYGLILVIFLFRRVGYQLRVVDRGRRPVEKMPKVVVEADPWSDDEE
ncbi:hypothetical protein [Blastopirellula retiformator]|uniref:Uncharacterized protein n=1 Tax=Blastopirellula retiformator TaxID=2527970 RepID=A0A5C5VLQ3_9BACT|nr:hypothetical protein [Blastopirellula retiformator]TWT39554.1 hypothetical protein Enr8_12540 [Blastopirellula retiformator]